MKDKKKKKDWGVVVCNYDVVLRLDEKVEGFKKFQKVGTGVEYKDGNRHIYLDMMRIRKLNLDEVDVLDLKIYKQ